MALNIENIKKIKLGLLSGFTAQGTKAIAIGYNAGYSKQGANSIVIGANSSAINSDNSIVVGSNASSKLDISNQLVIGFDASNVSFGGLYGTNLGKNNFRLGINTNNPQFTLDVSGEVRFMYIRDISGRIGSPGQVLSSTSHGILWKDDLSGGSGGGSQWTTSGNDIYNNNSGNVGIGTINSSSKLDISGNVKIRGILDMSNNVIREVSGIYFSDGTYIGHGSSFDISSNETIKFNTNKLVIDTNGNIGIGKINPSYKLDVNGTTNTTTLNTTNIQNSNNININNNVDINGNLVVRGDAFKPGGGSWSSTSDIRMKQNIEKADTSYMSNIIQDFPLYSYRWTDNYKNEFLINDSNKMYGTIAQELIKLSTIHPIFEQFVRITETSINNTNYIDFHTVNDSQLIYLLVGATKKLIKDNETIKNNIDIINTRLNQLNK